LFHLEIISFRQRRTCANILIVGTYFNIDALSFYELLGI
jgi:hypothetical protein